jgi:mannitol/fructose-specific phosphotransferase system IIA component
MEILSIDNIVVGLPPVGVEAAIRQAGRRLVDAGYVDERYIEGMLVRNQSFSCAIGNLLAIPHGAKEYGDAIRHTGLVVATYPEGLDWDGQPVQLVVGIAARGDEHLELLAQLVEAAEDEAAVAALVAGGDAAAIHRALTGTAL